MIKWRVHLIKNREHVVFYSGHAAPTYNICCEYRNAKGFYNQVYKVSHVDREHSVVYAHYSHLERVGEKLATAKGRIPA